MSRLSQEKLQMHLVFILGLVLFVFFVILGYLNELLLQAHLQIVFDSRYLGVRGFIILLLTISTLTGFFY